MVSRGEPLNDEAKQTVIEKLQQESDIPPKVLEEVANILEKQFSQKDFTINDSPYAESFSHVPENGLLEAVGSVAELIHLLYGYVSK